MVYSRFFTKALGDLDYFKLDEPFKGLFTQGMVTHLIYKNENGEWVEPKDVEKSENTLKDNKGLGVSAGKIEKMVNQKMLWIQMT